MVQKKRTTIPGRTPGGAAEVDPRPSENDICNGGKLNSKQAINHSTSKNNNIGDGRNKKAINGKKAPYSKEFGLKANSSKMQVTYSKEDGDTAINEHFCAGPKTSKDEHMVLTVDLMKGRGRYEIFSPNRRQMLNFRVKVDIRNPQGLKIREIVIHFETYANGQRRKGDKHAHINEHFIANVDLPALGAPELVTATVLVAYQTRSLEIKRIQTKASQTYK